MARALGELDLRLILAQCPQAKGRIERLWRTLQDRLVAELHLAGITTMDDANAFLPAFLAHFNARFAVPAADPLVAYRSLTAPTDLDRVFCFKYERAVRPDNTITFGTRVWQLQPSSEQASWARARVEIHEHLDGSVAVRNQDTPLLTIPAPLDTPTLRARSGPRPGARAPQPSAAPFPASPILSPASPPEPRPAWKPAPTHSLAPLHGLPAPSNRSPTQPTRVTESLLTQGDKIAAR